MKENSEELMKDIVSLAKRRGFIYQGSEIYGGLAGTWDYGPLGVQLKKNISNLWWKIFVDNREDIYGLDAAILMNARVWDAVGHTSTFTDPLVECGHCHVRFREDQLESKDTCPDCGAKESFGELKQFNMMFKTPIGTDEETNTYLRPETAQGMFVNFKNVVDSLHPKLPFGLAQIGKAFRNEISPRDFIFRSREFEQMEIEYFVREEDWKEAFEDWRGQMIDWMDTVGLDKDKIHEIDVAENDRAHYSSKTIDFEFDFPFGRKELYGLAYRTDYDLKNHAEASGVDLSYFDEENKQRFTPHVIEPSLGLDRTILAILASAYTKDDLGEGRVYLKLPANIAPVKVAVFPLLRNKPELVEKAREIYETLKKEIPQIIFDDNGNVGKRYRRQDEIGTPYCVTVDFDSLETKDVTVRDRDTGEQKRIKISELLDYFARNL